MATLYWGGGTGTWDGFTTTNWYTDLARTVLSTRAPSAEDDVIFDATSNATAYTVTLSNNTTVCRSCTIAGPASGNVTIAGTGAWYIYGDLTLPATGITRSFTGAIQFWAPTSQSITTNGVTLASAITVAAGTSTLQDALNNGTSNITVSSGATLNTNGKTVTCGSILGAGTLTLGASTVSATTIDATGALTVNGGTSSITLSSATAGIGGGTGFTGGTFYDVTFSSTAITTANIYGSNTFNNLTFAAKSSTTVSTVLVYGNQTVSGTLTISGQLSVRRYFLRGSTAGTARTFTVAAVAALTDVDFADITVAGASAPWSGTRLGNAGGNTNITFPAAKTVYWNSPTGGAWTGAFWATASGGSVDIANFPLAQDTAIINDTGLNSGASITNIDSTYFLGTLTSTKTNAFSITGNNNGQLRLTGNLTLTASITLSTAGLWSFGFFGRTTQNLTSAGNTLQGIRINNYGAGVNLLDALTFSAAAFQQGSLTTNNYTVTASGVWAVDTANTGPVTLNLGSSTVSIPRFDSSSTTAAPITINPGTSTVTITSTPVFGFAGQTVNWYNVVFSTASATINGNNTFNNLTFPTSTATAVSNITFAGNQTVTGTLAWGGGTSVTQRLGVVSDTPGTARTITAAAVSGLTDVDFRDITVAGASSPWSGTRLGNCGGNTNITFPVAKTVYWNLAGTQNWSATGWATGSGGSPAANNFPLAQDTAVFDNAGAAGTVTLNNNWNIGTINASGRSSAMTLTNAVSVASIYGDVTLGAGVTVTSSGTTIITFRKPGAQVFTSAGVILPDARITIDNPSCVFRHGDAFTGSAITLTRGTYETQNYTISTAFISSNNTNTRSITLGTSTITATGAAPIAFTDPTNLTFSGASSTINLSATGAKTFAGGGKTFGTVSSTGGTTNPLTITGSNTFSTFTNTARTNLVFAAGTTQTITNFTYSGASGSQVRWYTSTPGQRAIISTGAYTVGANSVDGGNNRGLTFTGSSPDYFYVKDISSAVTSFDVTVTESSTGADTVVTVFAPNATVSETASGADSIVAGNLFLTDIAESSTGADAVDATRLFLATLDEAASGADSVLTVVSLNASVAEAATGVDAFDSVILISPEVSETSSGSDTVTATRITVAVVEESSFGADELAAGLSGFPSVTESSVGADEILTEAVLNPTVDEYSTALDVVTCRYQWQKIDDLQDPNWQVITTPQDPAWSNITTDQGPDWTPIQT